MSLGFLALASVYLLTINTPIDLYRRLLALAVIWIGSVPTLVYLYSAQRPQIPFFPLVGLFYASNFGLPFFAASNPIEEGDALLRIENVTPTCLWLVIIGMACLLVGFYVGQQAFGARIKGMRVTGDWTAPRFRVMMWIYLIVYFAYRALPALKANSTVNHLLSPLGYLGFGFFFVLFVNRRLLLLESVIIWGLLVPMELAFRLSSGSIAEAMIFGLFFSLIAMRTSPKLAATAFILAILTFAVFNPVKGTYRMITWYTSEMGGDAPQSAYTKCMLLVQLAYEYHFGVLSSQDRHTEMLASLAGRLSSVTVFSLVTDETPSQVPYWKGESYLPLFTKLIPRAFWPDKPVDDSGNQFGHRYSLLGDNDTATSLNLPWVVEMYANFGAWGVYLGMTLVGFGLAWLDVIFNQRKRNPIELVIGATILLQLIYQESSFSLMVGDSILLFIVVYVALRVALPPAARRPLRGATS